MADDEELPVEESTFRRRSIRKVSVNSFVVQRNAKIEKREKVKKITDILKKPESERTAAEKTLVKKQPDIVKASQNNAKRLQATKDRALEIEDEPEELSRKCDELAELIQESSRIVVYSGAGISTAASIPDYRGPNGVWTLLKKGQALSAQDLSDAEPTFTHMSITKLFRTGRVKHVVSQNCDGLHIRSGYPRYALSEVHGNMFIECCYNCEPHKEYIRLFDVTEKTGVRRHTTSRKCRACGKYLTDTIVHFGEKGKIKSPYRWKEAVRAAKSSDLILCLGSSLKILRRYTCLWCMDKKREQRPKLVIVNLQWTPKDDTANLKINGRCDEVMRRVMEKLEYNVPEYRREFDPIFKFCTPLRAVEKKTTSKKILVAPSMPSKASVKAALAKSSKSKRKSKQSSITETSSSTTSSASSPNHGLPVSGESSIKVEKEEQDEDLKTSGTSDLGSCEDGKRNDDCDKVKVEGDVKPGVDTPLLKDIKTEIVDCKVEENVVEDFQCSMDGEQKPKEGCNTGERLGLCFSSKNRMGVVSPASSSISTSVLNFQTFSSSSSTTQSIVNNTQLHKNKVFLDQISSKSTLSPHIQNKCLSNQSIFDEKMSKSLNGAEDLNSFSLKKSSIFAPQEVMRTQQDSIGVLLVSQPPECLTDVCSLDLNSENPSAFPVCRIELPAVDEAGLDKDIAVTGKQNENSFSNFGGGKGEREKDEINLGSADGSDEIPSTFVVDLELMETNTAQHDQEVDSAQNSLRSSEKVRIDLDVDQWDNDMATKVKGVQSTKQDCKVTIGLDKQDKNVDIPAGNVMLDLNKQYLKDNQIHNNPCSDNKATIPCSSTALSQLKETSLLNSSSTLTSDSLSNCAMMLSKLHQPIKSSSSSSILSREICKTECHISTCSTNSPQTNPSLKGPTTQHLKSLLHQPISLNNLSQTLPPPPVSSVSTSSLKPMVSNSLSLGVPSLTNSLTSPRMEAAAKGLDHKILPSGSLIPKSVGGIVSQYPSVERVMMGKKSQLQSTSLSSSSSSVLSSSSQIPYKELNSCNVQKPFQKLSSSFSSPSSSSSLLVPSPSTNKLFLNYPASQTIPACQHNEINHSGANNINHRNALSIDNTLKDRATSSAVVKKERISPCPNEGNDNVKKTRITDYAEHFDKHKNELIHNVLNVKIKSPPQRVSYEITKNLQTPRQSTSSSHAISTSLKIGNDSLYSSNTSTPADNFNNSFQSQQQMKLCSELMERNSPIARNPNVYPRLPSKSAVNPCVLNMDDLLAANILLPNVAKPKQLKIPVSGISDSCVEKITATEKSLHKASQHNKNSISFHNATFSPERDFSPESRSPGQATSLMTKVTTENGRLDHGVILSENTDIPIKEDNKIMDLLTENKPFFMNHTTNSSIIKKLSPTDSLLSSHHKKSDPVSWRCVQKPSGKRSHNRNTIVLKADWGTPLTTLIQEPTLVKKTCIKQPSKALKRSRSSQKHSSTNNNNNSITPVHLISTEHELNTPVKKKAKKGGAAVKIDKLEKNKVKDKIKKIAANKKKPESNPPSSLPGWFGKGLAIKRKRKC